MDGTAFDFPSHGGMGHKFSSVPQTGFSSNISRHRKTVQVSWSFIHCDKSVAIFFLPCLETCVIHSQNSLYIFSHVLLVFTLFTLLGGFESRNTVIDPNFDNRWVEVKGMDCWSKGARSWLEVTTTTNNMGTARLTHILQYQQRDTNTPARW